jgi:hypothetical protein
MRKIKRWMRMDEDDEEHVPLTAYMARRQGSIDDSNSGTKITRYLANMGLDAEFYAGISDSCSYKRGV